MLGGAMPQKRALSRTFLVQTPHSKSHACRRRPCGSTPTGQSSASLAAALPIFAGAKKERPHARPHRQRRRDLANGLASRRLRRRHAARHGHLPDPLSVPLGHLRRPSEHITSRRTLSAFDLSHPFWTVIRSGISLASQFKHQPGSECCGYGAA